MTLDASSMSSRRISGPDPTAQRGRYVGGGAYEGSGFGEPCVPYPTPERVPALRQPPGSPGCSIRTWSRSSSRRHRPCRIG